MRSSEFLDSLRQHQEAQNTDLFLGTSQILSHKTFMEKKNSSVLNEINRNLTKTIEKC